MNIHKFAPNFKFHYAHVCYLPSSIRIRSCKIEQRKTLTKKYQVTILVKLVVSAHQYSFTLFRSRDQGHFIYSLIFQSTETSFKDKTMTKHRLSKRIIPWMRWLTLVMLSLALEVETLTLTVGLKRLLNPSVGESTFFRPQLIDLFPNTNIVSPRHWLFSLSHESWVMLRDNYVHIKKKLNYF